MHLVGGVERAVLIYGNSHILLLDELAFSHLALLFCLGLGLRIGVGVSFCLAIGGFRALGPLGRLGLFGLGLFIVVALGDHQGPLLAIGLWIARISAPDMLLWVDSLVLFLGLEDPLWADQG